VLPEWHCGYASPSWSQPGEPSLRCRTLYFEVLPKLQVYRTVRRSRWFTHHLHELFCDGLTCFAWLTTRGTSPYHLTGPPHDSSTGSPLQWGNTALHRAATLGNASIVGLLLEHNANEPLGQIISVQNKVIISVLCFVAVTSRVRDRIFVRLGDRSTAVSAAVSCHRTSLCKYVGRPHEPVECSAQGRPQSVVY
jgi:hypothetical protein